MGVGLLVGAAAGAAVGAATGVAVGTAVGVGMSLGHAYDNYQRKKEIEAKMNQSPTYSFGPVSNTKSQQLPIPIVYGKNRVGGNIIYQKITGEDDEEMDVQVAVARGPIKSISDIKANENDIDASVRLGKRKQEPFDINENDETFPFIAYISAHLTANEQVRGMPTITSIVEGRKVDVWTGSSWTNRYSRNPAWCLLDLLTNNRYGLGIDKEDIDKESFKEAADYCDEEVNGKPRFRLDYVIDRQQSSLDIITDILGTFRAYLLYSQGELRLKIDKEDNVVQSFGMDNIVKNSFTYEKSSKKDRPNKVMIQYINPDEHWEPVYAQYSDDGAIKKEGKVKEETISLLGISRFEQAGRMARYYLNKKKYCNTFTEFRVGIDSLHCEVGDVISVSHDVPGWIDKKFRILEISEYENDEMILKGQEYNEGVFSDNGLPDQETNESTLPNLFKEPEPVSNIKLSEYGYINKDGTQISNIQGTFKRPKDEIYKEAEILVSKNGSEYEKELTTENNNFTIRNIQTEAEYKIKIRSVSIYQNVKNDGVVSKSLYVTGKDNKPGDVEEFIVAQDDENVIFRWEKVDEPDVIYYEIREGSSWDIARLVATNVTGKTFKYDRETDGTKKYMIKAIDRGGNYSKNTKEKIFTVEDSGNTLNILMERSEILEGNGTFESMTVYNGEIVFAHNLSFANYPDLSFATASDNLSFNTMPSINTEGSYVSDVIDTYKIGRTGIRLRQDIEATDLEGSISSIPQGSFATYSQYSFAEPPALYSFDIYIRFSDDNSMWTDWQRFTPGQYRFRYCQIKFELSADSETSQIEILELFEIFDVPDVMLDIDSYSFDAATETITFADYDKDFYEKPVRYHAGVINDTAFPVFSNVTKDSLDITLKDKDGNTVSGTANIDIQGY